MLTLMKTENLVLRPNCLLTKAPLVFVPGQRSLFHFQKMAAPLQEYLQAHGYQVLSVPLPFRSAHLRRIAFSRWLQQNPGKPMHFIWGRETSIEFKDQISFPSYSTFTNIGESFKPSSIANWRVPISFRLHQLFCQLMGAKSNQYENTLSIKNDLDFDRFLDHCVQLAEDEITGEYSNV